MAIDKNLIHAAKKEDFEVEVANGNIKDSSIAFIEDTKEIWNHGSYYGTQLSVSEIEAIIAESQTIEDILTSKQDTITDLETIRSGAALGATALQEVPEDYAKKEDIVTYENATQETAGLMSAEDKTKLDTFTGLGVVKLTNEEYQALVAAGTASSDIIYVIVG